jgi:ubiquinone/menaquinone biosynthesis C-methylase UbiE
MKQGDFTGLAKAYVNRPGYSLPVLRMIARHVGLEKEDLVADVGAGTGKLTENLKELGLEVVAVEPNDDMRKEGAIYTNRYDVQWRKGSAEDTGLDGGSVAWVLMGSSFHWADKNCALAEFHRILKPGGCFTALWNPRDIERNPLHKRIEERIHTIAPEIKRVSSGAASYTTHLTEDLLSTGHFTEPIFVESAYEISMSPERYLGAWRSVNDIQAQAGPERFETIVAAIQEEIAGLETVQVPYKTRAWTVRRR